MNQYEQYEPQQQQQQQQPQQQQQEVKRLDSMTKDQVLATNKMSKNMPSCVHIKYRITHLI